MLCYGHISRCVCVSQLKHLQTVRGLLLISRQIQIFLMSSWEKYVNTRQFQGLRLMHLKKRTSILTNVFVRTH